MSVVIDASALVATLLDEIGSEFVVERLRGSLLSAVNYSETLSRVVERGAQAQAAEAIVRAYEIRVEPFTMELARIAAELRQPTRHLGLSLGDRACLALAKRNSLLLLTADRRLSRAEVGVDIRLIR